MIQGFNTHELYNILRDVVNDLPSITIDEKKEALKQIEISEAKYTNA